MPLTIFNGSPRGKKGNTELLMSRFEAGYTAAGGSELHTHYLVRENDLAAQAAAFGAADHVILAFPLYTDAMPGMVKQFIEALAPFAGGDNNPSLGFVVQSGFPEPIHSRYIEQYLLKLAHRLGCQYRGTVIRGGVEGIAVQPSWMTRKTLGGFEKLGRHYAGTGRFDERVIRKFAKRDRLTPVQLWGYRLLSKLGLANLYWNQQLKENGAFDRRFEAPYGKPVQ